MSARSPLSTLLDRSWTDPLTGTVFLADMELPANLKQFIQPAEHPSLNWVPSFLHEAMHHWCFQSPVGQTIALLKCRARRRCAQICSGENTEAQREQLMEDVLRSEAVSFLLQPLAEGLALLMEFDAVAGNAPALSIPMGMVLPLFTDIAWLKHLPPDPDISDRVSSTLFHALSRVRLSDEFIRRKTNLLAQPLSCDGGGYLAGYLTAKLMRNWALRQCDAFADSDLTAMFLRHFFYDDWELVAVLLDDTAPDYVTVNKIAGHLQQRVSDFFQCDFDSEVKRFLSVFGDGGDPKERQKPYTPSSAPDLIARGVERGARLQAEFLAPPSQCDDSQLDERTRRYYLQLLHQRQLIRLGVVTVKARVVATKMGENRAIALLPQHNAWQFSGSKESGSELVKQLGGFPILAQTAVAGIHPGEADGRLEIYMLPHRKSTMIIVSRGCETVAQMWLYDDDGSLQREFANFVPTAASDAIEADMRAAITDALEDSAEAIIMKCGLEALPAHRDEIYARWALANVSDDEHIELCRKSMLSDGLLGLDGMNFSLLTALARLSVASNFTSDFARLNHIDTTAEWNALGRIVDLQSISETTGLPFLVSDGNYLATMV